MMQRISRALALVALVALGGPGGVFAGEPTIRLKITPVDHDGIYFDLTLRPGQRKSLSVELANLGSQPVEVRTYAADVYTIVSGGLGAELHDESPSGPTRWVSYPTELLELPPRRGTVRDFTVELPEGVKPGEYITSLAIENAHPVAGSGSQVINQVNRTVIAIVITVPGRRLPALEIAGVAHELVNGTSVVSVRLINPGNVHLKPQGTFRLATDGDHVLSRTPITMGTFFAGTDTVFEVPLPETLLPGGYCASLSLHDAEQDTVASAECLRFEIAPAAAEDAPPGAVDEPDGVLDLGWLPWLALLAGGALIAVLAAVGVAVIGRRPKRRGPSSPGDRPAASS